MEVKLNQTEVAMLNKITDPVVRASVEKQWLEAKGENLKLRAQQQEKWNQVRKTFGLRLGELGHVLITGLGIRFPLSLYPDQFETLMSNAEAIRKFIADNKAEIERRSSDENRKTVLSARAKAKAAKIKAAVASVR